MKKKNKKIEYHEKRYNLDTLAINAVQTSSFLGVHAPVEIDITKLKRKENSYISL